MAIQKTFIKDIWYYGGFGHELKRGAMVHKTIAGHPIVIGRGQDGKVFALRDICPHRAAPLSAGKILDDNTVECPYHGWRFGLSDGKCDLVPALCAEQKSMGDNIKVRAFPVSEDGDMVWIYVAKDKRFSGTPDIQPPHFPITKHKPVLFKRLILNVHVDHAVIGLIDPAHVPFIHNQKWWRGGTAYEKSKKFHACERGFSMSPHKPSSNSFAYKLLGGKPVTEISFRIPGVRTEDIRIGDKTILSLTIVVPIDEKTTEITTAIFSDKNRIKLLAPLLKVAANVFLNQDGDIINLQTQCLEHGPNLMLLGDADQQARWYFALKKEWAGSRAEKREFVNPVKPTTLHWRT